MEMEYNKIIFYGLENILFLYKRQKIKYYFLKKIAYNIFLIRYVVKL